MSLHYLVKYECQKTGSNLKKCIAKHLSSDGLLHYKFVIQCAKNLKKIFKIGKHLVKLLAKWLIVSYAQFALHFCSQRCRTPKTSKITTVLWTESVTNNVVTLIGRLMSVHYQQISNCCGPVFTYWQTDTISDWPTADHVRHFAVTSFSLLHQLCTVGHWIFLYG